MKTSLAKLLAKLTLLMEFEAKHQPGARHVSVHSVDDNATPPGVVLFAAPDREWILATFGADGWETHYRGEDGWMHVRKLVDGVLVTMYGAYLTKPEPRPAPRAVSPALLMGEEVLA